MARTPDSLIEEIESPENEPTAAAKPDRGWSPPGGPPTTLVLVRHGVTAHTVEKRFSGGLASANPGLSDEGREQIRVTADWLAPIAEQIDAVIASPVRRTLESAEILAEVLGKPVDVEPGFAEMEFGTWDGKTFMDVAEQHKAELDAWLGSLDVAPGGGESFRDVEKRVLDGLQRLLEAHAGRTVVVVSHVTPIKVMVGHAVTAPLDSVFRMELSPASVSVLAFYGGGEDGAEAAGVDADVQRPPARPRGVRLAVRLGAARQDDEALGRPGHRDVAVDGPLDAVAERVRVDQDDQVELEALRQLGSQRPDARRRRERVAVDLADADDAGDALGVLGEPGVEDRVAGRTCDPCSTGTPLLRTEVGTLASGSTARMTGSASAMTSSGVR